MTHAGTTLSPQRAEREVRRGLSPTGQTTKLYGLIAEFTTPSAVMHAAAKVREAGYKWWDCHTPFPVHGLDKAMGVRPTILPWLVFGAGATGAMLGLILQWFTNGSDLVAWFIVWVQGFPYIVSGKPPFSLPAFIPIIFELTILLSAVGCVILMLVMNGLPRLYHPLFTNARFRRATDDRFFIAIEARDPRFRRSRTEEFLWSLNPIAVEAVED